MFKVYFPVLLNLVVVYCSKEHSSVKIMIFILLSLPPRFVPPILKGYLKQLMSAFIFMVMWPVLPNLVCDILFYGALYISPIHAVTEVVNRVRELVNHR